MLRKMLWKGRKASHINSHSPHHTRNVRKSLALGLCNINKHSKMKRSRVELRPKAKQARSLRNFNGQQLGMVWGVRRRRSWRLPQFTFCIFNAWILMKIKSKCATPECTQRTCDLYLILSLPRSRSDCINCGRRRGRRGWESSALANGHEQQQIKHGTLIDDFDFWP